MSKHLSIVVSVAIVSFSLVLCCLVRACNGRYVTASAGNGRIYRMDKFTGKTVLIHDSSITPCVQGSSSTPLEKKLTPYQLRQGYNPNHDYYADE